MSLSAMIHITVVARAVMNSLRMCHTFQSVFARISIYSGSHCKCPSLLWIKQYREALIALPTQQSKAFQAAQVACS